MAWGRNMLTFPSPQDLVLQINLQETIAWQFRNGVGKSPHISFTGESRKNSERKRGTSRLLLYYFMPHCIDSVHFSFLARLSLITENVHSITVLMKLNCTSTLDSNIQWNYQRFNSLLIAFWLRYFNPYHNVIEMTITLFLCWTMTKILYRHL